MADFAATIAAVSPVEAERSSGIQMGRTENASPTSAPTVVSGTLEKGVRMGRTEAAVFSVEVVSAALRAGYRRRYGKKINLGLDLAPG